MSTKNVIHMEGSQEEWMGKTVITNGNDETFLGLEYPVESGGDDAVFILQGIAQGPDDRDDRLFTHDGVQSHIFRKYESVGRSF